MKTTPNHKPDDKKIRPEIKLVGVSLIGAVLILGIYGPHSHWFARYDGGTDKSIISTETTEPEVPVDFNLQQDTNDGQVMMFDQSTNGVEVIRFNVHPRFSSTPVNVSETNDQRFVSNKHN